MSSPLSPGGNGASNDSVDPNELRELRLEVASLRAQLARRAAETEEYRKRALVLRSESERYSTQLRLLRSSTSWSITRPLRMSRRKALNKGWT